MKLLCIECILEIVSEWRPLHPTDELPTAAQPQPEEAVTILHGNAVCLRHAQDEAASDDRRV